MLDCRASFRPALVLLAGLSLVTGLVSPAVPAYADKRHPTPAEVAAADQKVRAARSAVQSLQVRAERAAEAYNGARVQAQRATAARDAARTLAQAAQTRFVDAHVLAAAARGEAAAARARADEASQASAQAALDAVQSQRALNQIAAGAYRQGGQLGQVSALMLADDPLELANARNLFNRVGDYQQQVIDAMRVAHQKAVAAEQAATAAKATATAAAERAGAVEEKAAAAKAEALETSQAASSAARRADLLLAKAERARAAAQLLVSQAERALGRAQTSAAAMRKAAAAARRDADGVQSGPAPSDAAATAIHWAFEEIGVPYAWGGGDENGPTRGFAQGANTVGFDCSGLTLFIYHKAGVHLDHFTGSQWDQGPRVTGALQPGDLMFFAYDTSNPATIHHVAIYIGNGKLIEAPYTGAVVRVASANRSDYIGATRPWA